MKPAWKTILMLIGCTIPLLLIFLAPALGLGESSRLLVFVVLMFACHLLMPHHSGHRHEPERANTETKT